MDTYSRAYSQKLPGKELDLAIKKLQQKKAKGEDMLSPDEIEELKRLQRIKASRVFR